MNNNIPFKEGDATFVEEYVSESTECRLQTLDIDTCTSLDVTFEWKNCPKNILEQHSTLEVS